MPDFIAPTAAKTPGPPRPSLVPRPPHLTCTVAAGSEITGLSEWSIRRLIREGQLRTVTVAGRRLISIRSLRQLLGEPEPDKGKCTRRTRLVPASEAATED